ncbi:MASE1 domain-containing protein, partial [Escherichia coli]|nr:MASE1 domain-containing protein [Escherichia coli]
MFIAGDIFAFPVAISTFFDNTDPIFTVVDMLSLIGAVLIFNMFFYYLMRMVVNPHYARALWCRDIAPALHRRNRLFTLTWLTAVSSLLIIMCSPYENGYIAGYLVPVFFIIFNMGVGRLKYPFLNIVWAISVLFLLGYNRNFLHGVVSEYSLAFILSV